MRSNGDVGFACATSRAAIGGPCAISSQALRILPVPRQMRSGGQGTTLAKDGLAERLPRFASMYRCVVAVPSCPSHSAITVISTPDCRRCIAVVCRRVCGEILRPFSVGHWAGLLCPMGPMRPIRLRNYLAQAYASTRGSAPALRTPVFGSMAMAAFEPNDHAPADCNL
jgi:hypothetical protein